MNLTKDVTNVKQRSTIEVASEYQNQFTSMRYATTRLSTSLPSQLHRDIKSDNVLLTDDYRVAKLCDFGLAKLNRKPLTGTTADAHMATNSIRPFEGTEVNEAIEKIKQGDRGDIPDDTLDVMREPIERFWDHMASRRPEAISFIAKSTWINEVEDDCFETIGFSTVASYEGEFERQDEAMVGTMYSPIVGSSNCEYLKHHSSIPPTTRVDVPQSTSKDDINQDTTTTVVSTKQQENPIQSLDVSQPQVPTKLDHQQPSPIITKSFESSESSPSVEEAPLKVRVINIRRQTLADNMMHSSPSV
ncbi:hypothetical protein BGW42_008700 [Actinomortierella wolfii]|nr:hypothetical protein BGW42_008700 [Actinomortierella wolfii]